MKKSNLKISFLIVLVGVLSACKDSFVSKLRSNIDNTKVKIQTDVDVIGEPPLVVEPTPTAAPVEPPITPPIKPPVPPPSPEEPPVKPPVEPPIEPPVVVKPPVTIETLKAERFVLSKEAHVLLNSENQDWKMYLSDGELQTDAAQLKSFYDNKKVACSFTSMGEVKHDENTVMVVTLQEVAPLTARDFKDEIQEGVDLFGTLKIGSQEIAATLSCINLQADTLDINALKQALGRQINSKK